MPFTFFLFQKYCIFDGVFLSVLFILDFRFLIVAGIFPFENEIFFSLWYVWYCKFAWLKKMKNNEFLKTTKMNTNKWTSHTHKHMKKIQASQHERSTFIQCMPYHSVHWHIFHPRRSVSRFVFTKLIWFSLEIYQNFFRTFDLNSQFFVCLSVVFRSFILSLGFFVEHHQRNLFSFCVLCNCVNFAHIAPQPYMK